MRLTLRTLLSYLDDTLEPAQAKAIGAKVAESEQARELVERIKQVTRRRRLTTPPTAGPGGIDPNTIAEYLDNEVSAEQAAEVEQICLASDVHLAEVAACHQILTLVLGEPALVPPSAKQRMYSLVKGPESIPFRKPSKGGAKDDLDLSSDMEADQDDTLRMGVPAVGGAKTQGKLWMFIGIGAVAACLFIVAVWQLVSPPHHPAEKKDGNQIVQADGKDKDESKKIEPPKTDDKKKEPVVKEKKDKEEKISLPKQDDKSTGGPEVKSVPIPKSTEVPYQEASKKQTPIGKYVAASIKDPAVLLQSKTDKAGWTRISGKSAPVSSGRLLLSLPGFKNVVNLDSGIELTLWGNLFEVTLDPSVAESRAIVHDNSLLDADLTLDRGRIILRNNKKDGQDARARIRFINPVQNKEEFFDVTMYAGSAVVVDRVCNLDREEPFYEDPKDMNRLGPLVTMRVFAYAGNSSVQMGELITIGENPIMVEYQPRKGAFGAPKGKVTPPAWFKGVPKLTEDDDITRRATAVDSYKTLASIMDKSLMDKGNKSIDVAVAEMVQSLQQAQSVTDPKKRFTVKAFTQWRYPLLCYAALDDIGTLFEMFTQNDTPFFVRGLCMMTFQQWLAQGRENDYALLDVVRKSNIKKTPSIKIMERFHMVTSEEAEKASTYQQLIEDLNNDLMPIRALSHWHLVGLVPQGQAIPYDPAMPRELRDAAVRSWSRLIPPGTVPSTGAPKGPPMKKDKGQP